MLISVLSIFQLLAATTSEPAVEIDRVCATYCRLLTVQAGEVKLIYASPSPRSITLGSYAGEAQALVPRTEAPIRIIKSRGGWTIVISVFLGEGEDDALSHMRFFDSRNRLRSIESMAECLEGDQIGFLFGGRDEILAVTATEEHAYNARTQIWLLPRQEHPKLLLDAPGNYARFCDGGRDGRAGLIFERQLYDGVHAATKRYRGEFYVWDRIHQRLSLAGQAPADLMR